MFHYNNIFWPFEHNLMYGLIPYVSKVVKVFKKCRSKCVILLFKLVSFTNIVINSQSRYNL